jgi:antitoxin VapB
MSCWVWYILFGIYQGGVMDMNQIAKIFMNGRSQAVRLPKDFRFDCDEVFVRKHGDGIIISPKTNTWDDFFNQESAFDDSFLVDREQPEQQERDFD